jgi:8-oxo-dGTP diphosphatase
MTETAFIGAKIAVLRQGQVLTLLRDDRDGIPWPGHWDLPGGGRDGGESPEACALRELREELALQLREEVLVWRRLYPSTTYPGEKAWFLVAETTGHALGQIVLGDEGQSWCWMPVRTFLGHPLAIPQFKARLADYLRERAVREAFSHA